MRQRLEVIVVTELNPDTFGDETVRALTEELKDLMKKHLDVPKKKTWVEYEPGEPV